MNLPDFRMNGPLEEVYYIPEFVTEQEEEYLIRKIRAAPQPKWKQLSHRRLQIWGGELTAKGVLIPQDLPPFVNKYPDIIGRIKRTGAFKHSPHEAPTHIIMNEYLSGQGIMPHEDGPAYHPVVATLSLGSHTVVHYYRYQSADSNEPTLGRGRTIDTHPVLSVLLEPRSLVITTSSLYSSYLHGIDGIEEDNFSDKAENGDLHIANTHLLTDAVRRDAVNTGGKLKRQTRYSLTCRDVKKIASGVPVLRR